ncbi:MAG: TetR/AcrR family transcriptional regulator [Pseudomonadota bacterium]
MMSALPDPSRRPRARNARPKIERAALKLFVSKSVEGATTREIAEEAGVSEGALYRHYPGKDELALSLFMETHNRLGRIMLEGWQAGDTFEDRVRRVVTAYCELADEDWLLFSFHLLSLNKFLPHDVRRDDDPVSITEQLIRGLIESGEIPEGDPAVLAAMSLGVMMQSGQNKAYNRLPGPMSQHIDAFTRAITAILKQK